METSLRELFRELSSGGIDVHADGGADDGAGGRGGGMAGGNGDSGGGTGTTGASVEALRTALAELSGTRFGAGKMDDAAEAMETILGKIYVVQSGLEIWWAVSESRRISRYWSACLLSSFVSHKSRRRTAEVFEEMPQRF